MFFFTQCILAHFYMKNFLKKKKKTQPLFIHSCILAGICVNDCMCVYFDTCYLIRISFIPQIAKLDNRKTETVLPSTSDGLNEIWDKWFKN